jgi:hypothetical protein
VLPGGQGCTAFNTMFVDRRVIGLALRTSFYGHISPPDLLIRSILWEPAGTRHGSREMALVTAGSGSMRNNEVGNPY